LPFVRVLLAAFGELAAALGRRLVGKRDPQALRQGLAEEAGGAE